MEIKIKLDAERVFHIANDHLNTMAYVEVWITNNDTLEQEAIDIPLDELHVAVSAFLMQYDRDALNK